MVSFIAAKSKKTSLFIYYLFSEQANMSFPFNGTNIRLSGMRLDDIGLLVVSFSTEVVFDFLWFDCYMPHFCHRY